MKCEKLSASRYKTNSWCEFKYYLYYHLGLKEKKKWPTESGSFCHQIYETLALQVIDGQDEPKILKEWFSLLVDAYRNTRVVKNRFGEEEIPPLWTLSDKALSREKSCDSCKFFADGNCWVAGKPVDSFEGCPKDEFEDTMKMIEMVISHTEHPNPKNKKVIAAEQSFDLLIDDGMGGKVPFTGVIDLVSELDSETIEIEDYKTGRGTQNWTECQKDIQFMSYYMAAREKYPQYKYIFVTIHYLKRKSGRYPVMVFTDKDEAETREKLVRCYYDIKNNKFPTRRCDRSNGFVKFDYVCLYMCDPDVCQKEWEKLIQVGHIENEDA